MIENDRFGMNKMSTHVSKHSVFFPSGMNCQPGTPDEHLSDGFVSNSSSRSEQWCNGWWFEYFWTDYQLHVNRHPNILYLRMGSFGHYFLQRLKLKTTRNQPKTLYTNTICPAFNFHNLRACVKSKDICEYLDISNLKTTSYKQLLHEHLQSSSGKPFESPLPGRGWWRTIAVNCHWASKDMRLGWLAQAVGKSKGKNWKPREIL